MSRRVMVITGGMGVLGQAVARAAAADGWQAALIDRVSPPAVANDAVVIGDVDLSDPSATQSAFETIDRRLGRIDALVNAAGGFKWSRLEESDRGLWDHLFSINLLTAVSATKAALPFLRRDSDAAIVNIGAQPALRAGEGMGAYAASKAGVLKLTESLSEELRATNVRVNAVIPSILDTPANRADMRDADYSNWVRPDDLAKVILFLASEAAIAVRNAHVSVTGRV